MAAGHVNQALLESNYQNPGEIYLDTKTEGAFQVLANQINDNFDAADAGSSLITGPNGSTFVGSPAIPLSVPAGTVYSQLTFLENQIQALVGGSIPPGTITESMLSADLQGKIATIQQNTREIARLKMESDIKNRVDGVSYVYYDDFGGLQSGSIGTLDRNKSNVTSGALSAGATTCTVGAGHGFVTGQEVTFQDVVTAATREVKVVTVSGNTLTFTALANSYAANALVYRSLVYSDAYNLKARYTRATAPTAITAAGTAIAAAGTANNRGIQRIVQLENGWLVVSLDTGTMHVSKDGGTTWAQLCTNSLVATGQFQGGIVAIGNTVLQSVTVTTSTAFHVAIYPVDVLTQTNVDIRTQTAFIIADVGVPSIQPSFPSFYAADDGTIFYNFATGNSGVNLTNIYMSSDMGRTFRFLAPLPGVNSTQRYTGMDALSATEFAIPRVDTSTGAIAFYYLKNGVSRFTTPVTVAGNNFPNVIIKRRGSNVGRVVVTYGVTGGVAYIITDDQGANFTAAVTIPSSTATTGDTQLSENANGDIVVTYASASGVSQATLPNGTTTFGAATILEAGATGQVSSIRKSTLAFTVAPIVYTNGANVKFRGTYTGSVGIDVLNADLRYNITPPGNVDTIVAWVDRDDFAGFSTNGLASIVAPGGNETYFALTKATSAAFNGHREDQFTGTDGSNTKVNLKVTMTRASVADDKGIYSITGAVGV